MAKYTGKRWAGIHKTPLSCFLMLLLFQICYSGLKVVSFRPVFDHNPKLENRKPGQEQAQKNDDEK